MEIEEHKSEQPHLIPEEIKYSIIFLKRQGMCNADIARKIYAEFDRKIHPASVANILEKYERTGNVANQWSYQGRSHLLTEEDRELLEDAITENLLRSCEDLKEELDLEAVFQQSTEN